MWFWSSITAISVGLQVSVLNYLWYLVCASLRGCFDTNRACCFGAGLSNASGSPAFHHAEANTEHSGLPAKKKKEKSESWWILYSASKTGINRQSHRVWSSGRGHSWPGFSYYLSSSRGDSHYLTNQDTWHSSQGKTSCSSAGLQGRCLPIKVRCEELNRLSSPILQSSIPPASPRCTSAHIPSVQA